MLNMLEYMRKHKIENTRTRALRGCPISTNETLKDYIFNIRE